MRGTFNDRVRAQRKDPFNMYVHPHIAGVGATADESFWEAEDHRRSAGRAVARLLRIVRRDRPGPR